MSINALAPWEGYKNYDHYWWVNPRNLCEWFNETVSIGYPVVGTRDCYYNVPAAFDIETSSFRKMGEKYATMYLWSLCINGSTLLGRTWEEFNDVIDFLEEHLRTRKVHLIIYVHNLGYEFQFMRKWFRWTKVFSVKERRPIHAIMTNGIEFKCSYILSNYALAYIGAKLLYRYPVQKAVGDLDYSLVRHYKTPITEKEAWYSVKDVQVVSSYIQEKIEQEGGIQNIPLTNTGYVRRYCREFCFTQFQKDKKLSRKLAARYHERMKTLRISSACEYDQLHDGFAGGFTHAAPSYSGKVLHGVGSADLASSYPAVMVMKKFPMSRGTFIGNTNFEEIESLISLGYCVLFTVRLEDVTPKFIYENYISVSRCSALSKDAVVNNGRVASASYLQVTVTEQDWDIIKRCYDWNEDTAQFYSARFYTADYLPRPFILSILHLFSNKTSLKGVEGRETEYMVSKNMINSAYGMSVTNIIRDLYEYSRTDEWVNTPANVTQELDSYNDNYNRFLFYAWGVWVTAHARHNLWDAIFEFGPDYVYADTDSIKGLNFENHSSFFTWYNFEIDCQIAKAAKYLSIPVSMYKPLTKSGVKKTIGVWEIEDSYATFKTIGAKRYIYEYESGELLFTVSGVNKHFGVPYLLREFSNSKYADLYSIAYSNDPSKESEAKEAMKQVIALHNNGELPYDAIFEKFNEGLYFPADATGKQTLSYLDDGNITRCTDYQGVSVTIYELSCIHMEPQAYFMSQSEDYIRFLKGFRDASL